MASADEIGVALIKQITSAFLTVERGNGVSLHEADVIDNYGSDQERAEARRLDTEKCWQEVPEGDLQRCDWRLSFLDPEGLRYYAPAYMIWALRYYRTTLYTSVDSLIFTFDLGTDTKSHNWQMARFACFTSEQQKAICGFLRFMAEHGGDFADTDVAWQALSRYWGQFC